jgi:hypothetical protein
MKFFDVLELNNLSPNQFSILYHLKSDKIAPNVNTSLEIEGLIANDWVITKNGEGVLLTKSFNLFKELDKTEKISTIVDTVFEENALKYNTLFPRITLGSKKPARTHIKSVIPALTWFFKTYEYTWDTVLEATDLYLQQEERSGWKYTRTSQYFVRKQDNNDKSFSSDLATYCELILGGEESPTDNSVEKIFK